MRPSDFDSLDEFIDAALKGEPIRRVPLDLQRSIQDRVERLAQAQRERRAFRLRVSMACGLFAVVVAVTFIAAAAGGLSSSVLSMVPGAMGYYDSMAVAAERWMIPAILIGLVTFTGVIAAAVLTETRNLRLWGSAV